MTTPQMPAGGALYADQPQTTVSNGGTDAPSSGTSEQWTVASSSGFPPASITAVPPYSFCVADTAATTEIIQVTAVSSTVWGVTRGADSTTPVTHASGFTVQQVVTASNLNNVLQSWNAGMTVATSVATTELTTIGTYTPAPVDVPAAGVVYHFMAFGKISNEFIFTVSTSWGGSVITSLSTVSGTMGTNMTNAPFVVEGHVCCYAAATMTCGMTFFAYTTNATHTLSTMIGASTAAVAVGGTAGPFALVYSGTATTNTTIVTTGFVVNRIS